VCEHAHEHVFLGGREGERIGSASYPPFIPPNPNPNPNFRGSGKGRGRGRVMVSLSRVGTRGFLGRRGLDRVTKYCVLIGPRPS